MTLSTANKTVIMNVMMNAHAAYIGNRFTENSFHARTRLEPIGVRGGERLEQTDHEQQYRDGEREKERPARNQT